MQLLLMKVFLFFAIGATLTLADYWQDRANLIEIDRKKAIGACLELNSKEDLANNILMGYKLNEYDDGFINPDTFLAGQHFFRSKARIEQSEVFKFIQKLPKGGSLHCHDTALVSQEYLFTLTYEENLYGCWKNRTYVLKFFNNTFTDDGCDWQLLSSLRSNNNTFDDFLKAQLTLIVQDPEIIYLDVNTAWAAFMRIFQTVGGLLGYKPVWEKYFYQVLKELYEDNVMYLEFRGTLPDIYDLSGTTYTGLEVVKLYYEVVKQFKKDHPDFYGVRFIYAPIRKVENKTIDKYVELCKEMLKYYPDFVAGFDLVGQEDLGYPLVNFIPQLLELKEIGTKFFFHAGETKWNGEPTDLNLFDAVLLNTTRIGHGYAIIKHPVIQDIVKERQIAIEISPISNQVLKMVDDIRNHPGSTLIANNFPIVITPDDPSFWGAKGLSYDWYMAFMAMASREADLKFLKQLAMNSIKFSAMGEEEKSDTLITWKRDWDKFIEEVISDRSPVVIHV